MHTAILLQVHARLLEHLKVGALTAGFQPYRRGSAYLRNRNDGTKADEERNLWSYATHAK